MTPSLAEGRAGLEVAMSCDVIRCDWWTRWMHLYERVPEPVREVAENLFREWIKEQMNAARSGGSGRKRPPRPPRPMPPDDEKGGASAPMLARTPRRKVAPEPPKRFTDLDDIFVSVKKSAELRERDWTPSERAEMEQKFDLLWGWLKENAELPPGDPPPVKSAEAKYPRISSLAGYAAVWDFVVLVDELVADDRRRIPNEPHVLVFFYGSDIDLKVLAAAGLTPERHEPAHVEDFELVISPLANILPSPGSAVHGILATATHTELERLYEDDMSPLVGGHYRPQAVLAMTVDGHEVPALTYVSHDMAAAQPNRSYVDVIAGPARDYDFPKWYQEHIASFAA
jgi:Gamma-glutamyl cyclotransferase, AIG2-like